MRTSPVIVGLGGLLSDPACCVIRDNKLVSAVEQAKVSRQDRAGDFPNEAFEAALLVAGVKPEDITCVAVARPFATGPESTAQLQLRARFPRSEIVVVEHHHAHAASAYYASGFDHAAILSVDRAGDFRSAVLFEGRGRQLSPIRELYFPDSFGDLFNRVTDLIGFKPRADEHKLQWLSTSGEPVYRQLFDTFLNRSSSGWPQFDRSYYDSDRLLQGGFSSKFFAEVGFNQAEPLTASVKANLAASLQAAVKDSIIALLPPGTTHICAAGGLALNALLVHALEQHFANVFVQPAAGNAGTALGAAFYAFHNFFQQDARIPFYTLCLGPAFLPHEIKQVLENCKLRVRFLLTEEELIQQAVRALNDNQIVAWMQGRMEFGPRALGNRSILASPLNPYSTENLNVYIKHREGFRKFAASVPEEFADKYFEVGPNARFLASVGKIKPDARKLFSAAILGEGLIRVHTVRQIENPLFHRLLLAAGESNGHPVLYNTSFNLFGDPLVCTPRDALRSFYSSGIDALFVGGFFLEK